MYIYISLRKRKKQLYNQSCTFWRRGIARGLTSYLVVIKFGQRIIAKMDDASLGNFA